MANSDCNNNNNNNNDDLILKTADVNERDFLICNLYKRIY